MPAPRSGWIGSNLYGNLGGGGSGDRALFPWDDRGDCAEEGRCNRDDVEGGGGSSYHVPSSTGAYNLSTGNAGHGAPERA